MEREDLVKARLDCLWWIEKVLKEDLSPARKIDEISYYITQVQKLEWEITHR